ncbi:MAG: PAS domain-containing protein, partial [Sulfurimonadaceae bacterium]|nr:PAS domain-containing protein [Sulfurimonadaceae bacterium]
MSNENNSINSAKLLHQYQYIVDATNIVSKADKHGIITYANSRFVEISGYELDELVGKPHNIVRDPSMPKEIFKELWHTIKAKKTWHGVITNRRRDDTQYTVEASIFPILDENEEIIEYIAIRHDITEMITLHKQVESLLKYDREQQYIAKEKSEAGIINDLKYDTCQVLYAPSDILSGDFYSLFKRDDGSVFLYIIDGQGHGISPALTVFAISTIIKQLAYNVADLQELLHKTFPIIKNFLGEIEQVSYTMIMIDADKQNLSY